MPDIECMDLTTKPLTEAPALERVPERSGSALDWLAAIQENRADALRDFYARHPGKRVPKDHARIMQEAR